MLLQFVDMILSSFFWRCCVSLVKLSHWFKFHVNIMTCCGFMTIFVYKGLTRNPEIGNTLVLVLPNVWRLGQVRDTRFCRNASDEKLLNAAKCQVYSFHCFWIIKGKATGGKYTLHHIKVNDGTWNNMKRLSVKWSTAFGKRITSINVRSG